MAKLSLATLLLSLSLSACGGSPIYKIAPIEAWVVDADTGQPIEGAVVTANWELVRGGLDGPRYYGQLEVKETVTDKNGRFYLEGFTKANPGLAELRNHDPKILVFKRGYRHIKAVNQYPNAGTSTPGVNRKADVSGEKLQFIKLESGSEKSLDDLGSLIIELRRIVESDCGWQKIPQMILALDAEYHFLRSKNISSAIYTVRNVNLGSSIAIKKCGSSVEFFEKLKK